MSDLISTTQPIMGPEIIDPKQEVLCEFDKAEQVVNAALKGTLNTISVARSKIQNGEFNNKADLYWMRKLAKDIQCYVELIP